MDWQKFEGWGIISGTDEGISLNQVSDSLKRKRRDTHMAKTLCLWGRRGDGKTATGLHLAEILAEIHRERTGKRRRIITNVLSFKKNSYVEDNVIRCESPFEWVMLNLKEAVGSIFVVDELLEFLPAVRHMSGHSLQAEHYLRMTRKLKMDAIFTSISPFRLTGAAFGELDYLARSKILITNKNKPGMRATTVMNIYNAASMKRDPQQDLSRIPTSQKIVTGVEKVFPWYDTDELLVGPFVPHADEIRKALGKGYKGVKKVPKKVTESKLSKAERTELNRERNAERIEERRIAAAAARGATA